MMLQLFTGRKEVELRHKGHEKWVFTVKAHSDGDWIFSSGWDKTIRVVSRRTGKCFRKLEGHEGYVWRVILLDMHTLLSVSDDKTAKIWKISSGDCIETLEFDVNAWSSKRLDDEHFVIGMISGEMHIFRRRDGRKSVLVHSFVAHQKGINDFSIWRDRLATASIDETVKIWDANTFKCLATLSGNSGAVRCVSMRDSYIATCSWDVQNRVAPIIIYNAKTYQFLRKFTVHKLYTRFIKLLGPKEFLFSCSDDGTTRLFDTSNGNILWTKNCGAGATTSAFFRDGQIVTGLNTGDVIVYRPPANLAPYMKALEVHRTLSRLADSPLQDALISCVSGYSSPIDHCKKLITYAKCRVSFEEWYSAHRILMLAVDDGDVCRDTTYNNEHSYWFDRLYVAVRDIEFRNHEDYVMMKSYLGEAKANGVIESIEAILTARLLTSDVKKTVRTFHRAGILIMERILEIENRIELLRKAYSQFLQSQRKSQLIGIALQVLPIAGGAMAGALSAGSEIVKGLSVKDVTDYALGLGSSILEGQADGDYILQQAADSLSPNSIEIMDPVRRQQLEDALRSCGLSVEVLHDLFLERLEDRMLRMKDATDSESSTAIEDISVKLLKEQNFEEEDRLTPENCNHEEPTPKSETALSYKASEITTISHEPLEGENRKFLHDVSNTEEPRSKKDSVTRETRRPKSVDTAEPTIEAFSQEEIAFFWADYIYEFKQEEHSKVELLKTSLLKTLKKCEIHGRELHDTTLISVHEIASKALEGLEHDCIDVTLQFRIRLKQFLLDLRSYR